MVKFLLLGIAIILSTGCAGGNFNDKSASQEIVPLTLPSSLIQQGDDYTLSQILTVDYARKIYRAVVEVEKQGDKVIFVGMDPLGNQVFSIVIEGEKTEYNGEMNGIKPHVIITDYLLTFAPLDLLNNELAKRGYRLTERTDGLQRRLLFDNEMVVNISYSIADKYRSTIELDNNSVGYRINIKNSEQNKTDDR
jgi:hypothetical protein